jgi:hypothetical protein
MRMPSSRPIDFDTERYQGSARALATTVLARSRRSRSLSLVGITSNPDENPVKRR